MRTLCDHLLSAEYLEPQIEFNKYQRLRAAIVTVMPILDSIEGCRALNAATRLRAVLDGTAEAADEGSVT